MKNLVVLTLGVFLCVAFTEGLLLRSSGSGKTVNFQNGEAEQLHGLPRERRDGLATEMREACIGGDHNRCNAVCVSAGSSMGGCRGKSCRCFE